MAQDGAVGQVDVPAQAVPRRPVEDVLAHLPEDRRAALAAGRALPERPRGAALFADVSGFTPLTEALVVEHGAREGAEALSSVLDRVYAELLGAVQAWGGSTLYFSGDAVTCWFEDDDGLRAVASALDVQRAVARTGQVVLPSGRSVLLGVKVAVAVGTAVRFVAGDPQVCLLDVLGGAITARLAAAEQESSSGEVLLDDAAARSLAGRVRLGERRGPDDAPVHVLQALLTEPARPAPPPPLPPLDPALTRPWLLPAVHDRVSAGQGEFLADLRPAVPLFLRFGGFDLDADPAAPDALAAFLTAAQRAVAAHGGSPLALTIGDKGAYLPAVFGAPVAHEDDADRACAAALDLLALDGYAGATGLQVGVASGRLHSGAYGAPTRRTFSALGAPVNLAARLMGAAAPGTVLVAESVAAATRAGWDWEAREPVRAKGIAEPVPLRRLRGRSAAVTGQAPRSSSPLLGRADELAVLRATAAAARAGHGGVAVVLAEAGAGKTRLVDEAVAGCRDDGDEVVAADARAADRLSAYPGWRGLGAALLDLPPDLPTAALQDRLTEVLGLADPALVPRLPLLGPLLGVPLPDTPLTAPLDAARRKTSLEDLVVRLLAARARRRPLVLVLGDAHWLDPLGLDLLQAVGAAAADLPLLVLATARPADAPAPEPAVERLDGVVVLPLGPLDDDAARALLLSRLPGPPSTALLDLLVARAEGNPFYLEQLAAYVLETTGGTVPDAAAAAELDLPPGLSTLVLSRLDRLAEGPRRTVKVASVAGRSFSRPLLAGAYPELGPEPEVGRALGLLVEERLLEPDDDGYRFGHAVTREVAYESLPTGLRTLLHGRIGAHLEQAEPEVVERRLGLLAHHFGLSGDLDRKRSYLVRAGRAAAAVYANAAAVDLLGRAAPLLDAAERGEVLLSLGAVLELSGQWQRAEEVYAEAVDLPSRAPETRGRARTALAEVARKQGRFPEAGQLLAQAEAELQAVADDVGLGRVLHLQGTLASQQADYAAARAAYGRSLALRRRTGDRTAEAALLSNLALVAENEGDLDEAERLGRQALALREDLGDRWGTAVSQVNLGMLALLREQPEAARPRFTEGRRLGLEVGDPWVVTVAEHNAAIASRQLHDAPAAAASFGAALEGYLRQGDRWSLTMLLEDLALLLLDGPAAADGLVLLGGADALREQLGAPRPPAVAEQLAAPAASAEGRLGPGPRATGQELSEERVLARAASLSAEIAAREPHRNGTR